MRPYISRPELPSEPTHILFVTVNLASPTVRTAAAWNLLSFIGNSAQLNLPSEQLLNGLALAENP